MNRIDRVLELALGGTFLAAGVLKILDPSEFAGTLASMRLLPDLLVGATAILLPWVEIVSGAALLATRRYRDAATALVLGLLGVFTLVQIGGLFRGGAAACGCFGTGIAFLSRPGVALGRNGILIGVAAVLVARRRKATSPAGPTSPA